MIKAATSAKTYLDKNGMKLHIEIEMGICIKKSRG
jgi:hypothetical protein